MIGYFTAIIALFLCFYIPGRVLIKRAENLNPRESLILSFGLGIALWGLQGYAFGWSHFRFLTYPYLAIFLGIWGLHLKDEVKYFVDGLRSFLKDRLLVGIMAVGLFVVLASVFPSGFYENDGIRFYEINAIDGTYHLALINSLVRNVPPEEPGMVGYSITNYHYWSDLVLAEMTRIFHTPIIPLFYQVFPLLLAILYGFTTYEVGWILTKNKYTGYWFAFMFYFSGGVGYLFSLIFLKTLSFNINGLDHAAALFTNPPRTVAQLIFLLGIIALYKWLKQGSVYWGIIMGLLLGVTVGFKVYVGMVAAFGLGALFVYFLLKREWKMFLPIFVTGLLSMAIFFPTNPNTGGIFFSLLSWPRHFFAQDTPALLNWQLQEQTFFAHHNYPRVAILWTQMTIVFLAIIYGTRALAFFIVPFVGRWLDRKIYIFLLTPLVLANILPLLFLQRSGVFEIFNLFAVAALLMSVFIAIWLGKLTPKLLKLSFYKKAAVLSVVAIFIVLTASHSLFYSVNQAVDVYTKNGRSHLFTRGELLMFDDMSRRIPEDSIVIVDPRDPDDTYAPYVAAFSGRRMYLSGKGVLRSRRSDIDEREKTQQYFYLNDAAAFATFARNNNISYVYLKVQPYPAMFASQQYFEDFASYPEAKIVKVKNEK